MRVSSDPVRLHGAIVAALEIHGAHQARSEVSAPALATANDHRTGISGRSLPRSRATWRRKRK